MNEQQFIKTLPINNFYRFIDIKDWEDTYSYYYPNANERQEIYEREEQNK
jgi:hypothetical protein